MPTVIESIAIVVISIATSTLLYSEFFRQCCMDEMRAGIAIILLPAMLIQLVLEGGNIHGGGSYSAVKATVGLAIQFFVTWWFFRLIWNRYRNRKSSEHRDVQ